MAKTIYIRPKNENGKWEYQRVETGRGKKTSQLAPPFFVRPFIHGKQRWHELGALTFAEAEVEASKIDAGLGAASQGLTVEGLSIDPNRKTLKAAVDFYLTKKSVKEPKTLQGYELNINEFLDSTHARYLDEVNAGTLSRFAKHLADQGYSPRTQYNMCLTVLSMLKVNKHKTDFSLKGDLPDVVTEPAVPYTQDELDKLWAVAEQEEKERYKFFLGTACREKEVQYAAWQDINFEKKTFEVRRKDDVGFKPKSHESRTVPLPDSLVGMLKARRAKDPKGRWIFVNELGKPDGHFLRKLKILALKARINCGHCETEVTKGRYEDKRKVRVSCKTDPVCEHIYLHRFRKTCATRWNEAGVDVFSIQEWLGHDSPETTRKYVGRSNVTKLRSNINSAFGD